VMELAIHSSFENYMLIHYKDHLLSLSPHFCKFNNFICGTCRGNDQGNFNPGIYTGTSDKGGSAWFQHLEKRYLVSVPSPHD